MYTVRSLAQLNLPRQIESIITLASRVHSKLKRGSIESLAGGASSLSWAKRNNWEIKVFPEEDVIKLLNNFMEIDEESMTEEFKQNLILLKETHLCSELKTGTIISLVPQDLKTLLVVTKK